MYRYANRALDEFFAAALFELTGSLAAPRMRFRGRIRNYETAAQAPNARPRILPVEATIMRSSGRWGMGGVGRTEQLPILRINARSPERRFTDGETSWNPVCMAVAVLGLAFSATGPERQ